MTIQGRGNGRGRPDRPQVAVVGAGVAGLTAAYLLQRAFDVTLYEAQDRLGGHAHTHDIPAGDGRLLALDSGFLVHNMRTYPNLIRLFGELGFATQNTEMSMSVRCEGCGLEYAGSRGPLGLFPTVGSVIRPEYLAALAAVPGFYQDARRLLASPGPEPLSLGEFLRQGGYRRYFVTHFVIPLVAAVWSCPQAEALAYPARYLFEFLDHHGMLRVTRSPGWRTADADRYVHEQTQVGELLGASPLPDTAAALSAWVASHPRLAPSPASAQAITFLRRPPLPPAIRAAYHVLLRAAIATLPSRIQQITGLPSRPGDRTAGRAAVTALRWALGSSPDWQLALARTGSTPAPQARFRQPLPTTRFTG